MAIADINDTKYEMEGELFRHQERAIEWMADVEDNPRHGMVGGILCLTQGLGKTLTAITHVVCTWLATPMDERRPALILVKKAVLPEWKRCIEQFYPGLVADTVFLHADYMRRRDIDAFTQEIALSKMFVITTYDTLMYRGWERDIDCCLEYGAENSRFRGKVMGVSTRTLDQTRRRDVQGRRVLYYTPWRFAFADESQVFANPGTKTYRAVMGVYGQSKWCLTGTPIRNECTDLYAQLRWCGMSDVIASTPLLWKRRVHEGVFDRYRLDRFILNMDYTKAGVKLPEKKRHVIAVELESDEEKAIYENMRQRTLEALHSASISNHVTYAHVLALFTRLRQTCVAAHVITPQSKRDNRPALAHFQPDSSVAEWCLDREGTAGIMSTKLQKMVEVIKRVPADEKVVIFSNFVALMDLAEEAVMVETDTECFMIDGGISGTERDTQLAEFKAHPGKAVLFVNYKVGAEGLNITEANHVICLEPWWNYATHSQAEARCWRIGQTRNVHVYDIFIKDSIESRILEICSVKREQAEAFFGRQNVGDGDKTRMSLATIYQLLGP